MSPNDLSSIRTLLKEELEPINVQLEAMQEDILSLKSTVDQHTAILDQHTGTLIGLQNSMQALHDMHAINHDENQFLKKRVSAIEEHVNLPNQVD